MIKRRLLLGAAVLAGAAWLWARGFQSGYSQGEVWGEVRGTFKGARGVMEALSSSRRAQR